MSGDGARTAEIGSARRYDETAYAAVLRDLEVEARNGGKKKGDFMVDNCVCCLVCCPGKLRG